MDSLSDPEKIVLYIATPVGYQMNGYLPFKPEMGDIVYHDGLVLVVRQLVYDCTLTQDDDTFNKVKSYVVKVFTSPSTNAHKIRLAKEVG